MPPMDPIFQIKTFNSGRDPERLTIKYSRMRANAFAFFRGTCHLFYDRLSQSTLPRRCPLVWACGDLHLENFGSYKADNRLVYFDLNDFDEAALAPASWDLIRMLTSVRVAAQGVDADTLCAAFLYAYGESLATGKSCWLEREAAQGPVKALLDRLRDRSRLQFLDSRTQLKGKRRAIRIDGKRALAASSTQRARVVELISRFSMTRPRPEFFGVVDVARRVAGTGSLGVDRFAILVQGKGSPDGNYLLDLKLSAPSVLLRHLQVKQPRWSSEAHRVVAVQQRSQAMPMAFLQPVLEGDAAYVLRGLQAAEDRINLDSAQLQGYQREAFIASLGSIVAWAHLRSAGRQGSAIADELIEFGQRKKWQAKLVQASRACAEQARADTARFNAAYDDGIFRGH